MTHNFCLGGVVEPVIFTAWLKMDVANVKMTFALGRLGFRRKMIHKNSSRERRERSERSDRCGAVVSPRSMIESRNTWLEIDTALTGHSADAAFPAAVLV
jgi:hypothetical protein